MIGVLGASSVVLREDERACDPAEFLVSRKSRKFMGLQDQLAVVAVGRALASAGLERAQGERTGLFAAVGYIPFERADIDPVLADSLTDGRFDVLRFGREGYTRAHPLLTFRCLPNMPAYHVSANFDVRGPCMVGYPGPGQTYLALDEARALLEEGAIDRAIVLGVAHQRNFLVEHHHERIGVGPERLRDAGACVLLARDGQGRARARLDSLRVDYTSFDPLAEIPTLREAPAAGAELGPASPLAAVAAWIAGGARGPREHRVDARDGLSGRSRWVTS